MDLVELKEEKSYTYEDYIAGVSNGPGGVEINDSFLHDTTSF